MRYQRPDNFTGFAKDGWILLRPGAAVRFCIDTDIKPTEADLLSRMGQIRGMVLSAGFSIEDNIVQLILLGKFGTTDPTVGGVPFSTLNEELRNNRKGLESLLNTAKPILRNALGVEAEALIQRLAEYRRLRNLCAHRPCWIEAIWDPEAGTEPRFPKGRTVGYKLYIADKEFIWELDDKELLEWHSLLNGLISDTHELLSKILTS